MIKRILGKGFFGRLFGTARPKIITRDRHSVSRESISPCALRVTETLQARGYAAFVVGGAVRDLLLGGRPKDFDVATNATPEEVRQLFRRSRVIGRRFRLVHVMCGPETVEVSTFRGPNAVGEGEDRGVDEHGRILRDNVFGTQEQDATRRDFSVNALFYDPATEQIWDYHGGVADLRHGRLRLIGSAEQRFREDPIRMLRAVRFAACRGLELDAQTRAPLRRLAGLLANVPPSRLVDEMLKLLLSGHAVQGVQRLRQEGLHHGVLPLLDVIMEQPLGERFVMLALRNTDERVLAGKPVSPGFLFAALLWHEVLSSWRASEKAGEHPVPALLHALDSVLKLQREKLAIPHRFSADMTEIWLMQPRFDQRFGRRPWRLLEHPRFRAGYDFLLLRCESGEVPAELGDWWARFQRSGETERNAMLVRDGATPAKSRRRRRRRRSGGDATAQLADAPSTAVE